MATTVMKMKAAPPTSARANNSQHGRRQVGFACRATTAPRSRASVVSPQAAYFITPRSRAVCRPPIVSRSPLLGGLDELVNTMLASDWLRDTTSRIHPVDIHTQDDRYLLQADCPGMSQEDIAVEVSPDKQVLTIAGARRTTSPHTSQATAADPANTTAASAGDEKPQAAADGGAAGKTEEESTSASASAASYSYSYRFQRSFQLPEDADADAISASLDKGVLTVTVPRRTAVEKPQARRVAVN